MEIGVSVHNDELPKDIKYLVMVFNDNSTEEETGTFVYAGFLTSEPQMQITEFLVGTEKSPLGVFVQLPKLFSTEQEAQERIDQHRKINSVWKQKHFYKIVPVDIG